MKMLLCVALVLLCLPVGASERSTAKTSSRTQSRSGRYGHFVSLPSGAYEGVAVAGTRRDAIRNACYANDTTKRVVSKATSRGADGRFYSSVIYRPQ